MAQRSLSVSISLPLEMDERIAEEANEHDMKYSEYVRQALRESMGTPFECDETVLTRDGHENISESETGAA